MALSPQEQTVATEQQPAAPPTDTDPGAQAEPSLDEVLAEFDQGTTEPQPSEPSGEQGNGGEPQYVTRQEYNALVQTLQESDLDKAVSQAKDSGVSGSARAIKGLLIQMAQEKPGLEAAFAARRQNPQGWDRALKAAIREMRDDFGAPIDSQVTTDTEALAAAVRGTTSATTPDDEAPNFDSMSDADFANWKQQQR